jgi:GntR family transcriptional repressor for pyruvate dehydrogenase complex/GntR family galactonate operon transcriptional repressor
MKVTVSKLLKGLDPVPRTTLSEQVAKLLAARITAGDWRPGEKLPSEAELCKAFSVGRSSLREALTSLTFIGLIRVRAGGGSYVAEQPSAYFTGAWLKDGLLTNRKALAEFVEARLILEPELAGLCAARITPQEQHELELLLQKMRDSIDDPLEFSKSDLSFHLTLGIAAKNEVLHAILVSVREQTLDVIAKSLLLQEGMENAIRGHIKILDALRQRSPLKAQEAMRAHLQSFQRGYQVAFESESANPK